MKEHISRGGGVESNETKMRSHGERENDNGREFKGSRRGANRIKVRHANRIAPAAGCSSHLFSGEQIESDHRMASSCYFLLSPISVESSGVRLASGSRLLGGH